MKKFLPILSLVLLTALPLLPVTVRAAGTFTSPQVSPNATSGLNYGLVGYWTMDGKDISGTSVTDRSGQGNAGTSSGGPTPLIGKIGQALALSNSAKITIGTNSPVTTSRVTVCSWVKPNVTSRGDIVTVWSDGTGASQFDLLYGLTAGKPQFYMSPNNASSNSGVGSTAMVVGRWYFVCGTYDGTTISVWLNGVVQASATYTTTVGSGVGQPITIGNNTAGDGQLNASVDDVRVYNRALSATEIAQLYTQGTGGHVSASPVVSPSATSGLNSGLVGYWTLDGKDISGTSVTDRSGNGYTGTTVAGPTALIGKIGQGLSFASATHQYIDFGTPSSIALTSDNTLSLWVNMRGHTPSGNETLINHANTNAYNLTLISGGNAQIGKEGITGVLNSTSAIPINGWHHLVCIRSGNTYSFYIDGVAAGSTTSVQTYSNSANLIIGNDAFGSYLNSAIDEVRIYNRALSATEVAQLYTLGTGGHVSASPTVYSGATAGPSYGLVGYWPLDGKNTNWTTGQTTDASGQGNSGQLINLSTTTSPVIGKLGQALRFDGTTQYVTVANGPVIPRTGSVTVWWKPNESVATSDHPIFTTRTATKFFDLYPQSDGNFYAGWYNSGIDQRVVWPVSGITAGTWYFVTLTWTNGGTTALYINTAQKGTTSGLNITWNTFATPNYIAADGNNLSITPKADIDDLRIYNRVLSTAEILQLYKQGSGQ